MKLEGELAFYHSNIGREPESQSFQFSDNDLDSAGYKVQNLKVKGYENDVFIDFKSGGRDSDLSAHDMDDSADCMNKQFSNHMTEETQVRDLVDPLSPSPNDPILESFMKLPNDIESVRRSAASPASNNMERMDSFENSLDVYMDKSVSQCEPEKVVCYRDSSYDVKDICVDEGVPKTDKVLFNDIVNEKAYPSPPSECYDNKEIKKDSIEINALTLSTEESDQVSTNQDQLKDLMMHEDEDLTEKHGGNINKEMVFPGDKVLSQELDTQQLDAQESKPSEDKGKQVSGELELHSQAKESENMIEEAVLPSKTSSAVDKSSGGDTILLDNGTFNCVVGPSAPAACGKEECRQVGSCVCGTQKTSGPVDNQVTDGLIVTSQERQGLGGSSYSNLGSGESNLSGIGHHGLGESSFSAVGRHGLGESSFSAVGPVSSRISYSGPVPYSGSISLRSDSSTTSTRSFAFPILQNEWNSSPVRMAKAEKMSLRKPRTWRHGLLCCRF